MAYIFPANTPLLGDGGFVGNPASMFSIRVNYRDSKGFADPNLFRYKSLEAVRSMAMSVARTGGNTVVDYVKARLTPGQGAKVGASGQAAENIDVRFRDTGSTISATVVEGSYPGNYFIRVRPRPTSNDLSNKPPNRVLVEWLIAKNIPIKQPERQRTWRMTKYGGSRANIRSKPSRPWKRDLRTVASIIGYFIAKEGRKHFDDLMPQGQDIYDYYAEFFSNHRGRLEQRMDDASYSQLIAFYRFLKTGYYQPSKPLRYAAIEF